MRLAFPSIHSTPCLLLLSSFLLAGCGGGGGGGSNTITIPTQLTYTGLTTPAPLTNSNANSIKNWIFAESIFSNNPLVSPSDAKLGPELGAGNGATIRYLPQRHNRIHIQGTSSYSCNTSGSMLVNDQTDASGLGPLTIQYKACADSGVQFDGVVVLNILTPSHQVYTYHQLKQTAPVSTIPMNLTIDGTVDYTQAPVAIGSQTTDLTLNTYTYNTVTLDAINNVTYQDQSLVEVDYTSTAYSYPQAQTLTGVRYRSDLGYVNVSTPVTLIYPANVDGSIGQLFGYNNFGNLIITNGSASMRFTPVDQTDALAELDADGDGIYEWFKYDNLTSPEETNDPTPPILTFSTLPALREMHRSPIVDISTSSALSSKFLKATWTVLSAPIGSAVTGNTWFGAKPALNLDVPGSYSLQVTLTDGLNSTVGNTAFEVYQQMANLPGSGDITNYVYDPQTNNLYWVELDPTDSGIGSVTSLAKAGTFGSSTASTFMTNSSARISLTLGSTDNIYVLSGQNLSVYSPGGQSLLNSFTLASPNIPAIWAGPGNLAYLELANTFASQSDIYALDTIAGTYAANGNALFSVPYYDRATPTPVLLNNNRTIIMQLVNPNSNSLTLLGTSSNSWSSLALWTATLPSHLGYSPAAYDSTIWANPSGNIAIDGVGHVFDLTNNTFNTILTLPEPLDYIGDGNDSYNGLAFSLDGRYVAYYYNSFYSGSKSSMSGSDVAITDLTTGKLVKDIQMPTYNQPNCPSCATPYTPSFVSFDKTGNYLQVISENLQFQFGIR